MMRKPSSSSSVKADAFVRHTAGDAEGKKSISLCPYLRLMPKMHIHLTEDPMRGTELKNL